MLLAAPNPTKWDLKFRAMGVPVVIAPWFWAVCLILGPLFDKDAQGNPLPISYSLIWIAVVFISVLVHELGHALSGRHFGMRNQKIFLYGMGGLASADGRIRDKQRILMILAGPAAGLALGGLTYAISYFLASRGIASKHLNLAIHYMLFVNIVWSVVNLLPVFPLDGGQVALTGWTMKDPRNGPANAMRLSIVAGIVIAVLGITKGYMFVGVMFAMLAYQSYQMIGQMNQMGYGRQEPDPADWWRNGRR